MVKLTDLVEQKIQQAEQKLRDGEVEAGIKLFEEVLAEKPDSATALFALGSIDFQNGQTNAAEIKLAQAHKIEPDAVDIALNYGAVLAQIGRNADAISVLQKATKYCQDDAFFCPQIAMLFRQLGEPQAAVQLLSRLNALTPNDQIILANANADLHNYREATNILKRLYEDIPNEPLVAVELSKQAALLKNYELAISAWEQYLRLTVPKADDYIRFADLLLNAGEIRRCHHALSQATNLEPEHPEIAVIASQAYIVEQNQDKAEEVIVNASSASLNNPRLWQQASQQLSDDNLTKMRDSLQQKIDAAETELLQQPLKAQASFHFSLAEMYDRDQNLEKAGIHFDVANSLQSEYLRSIGAEYNPEYSDLFQQKAISNFGAETLDAPSASFEQDETQITPIFIVGVPLSGSLVLESEFKKNNQVYSSGGLASMEYVAQELMQHQRANRLPETAKISSEQWTQLRQQYLKKLPEVDKPIFVDSLEVNFRYVGLILKLFPDARVIQLQRPLEQSRVSLYTQQMPLSHSYSTHLQDIEHFHAHATTLMQNWSSLNSSQILSLDYQDLKKDPSATMQKVMDFCGLNQGLEKTKQVQTAISSSELQQQRSILRGDNWQNYQEFLAAKSED